jgi:hypothetical protein
MELAFIPDLQGRPSFAYCLERIREVPALIGIRCSTDRRQLEEVAGNNDIAACTTNPERRLAADPARAVGA